jgi:hypothetical protein
MILQANIIAGGTNTVRALRLIECCQRDVLAHLSETGFAMLFVFRALCDEVVWDDVSSRLICGTLALWLIWIWIIGVWAVTAQVEVHVLAHPKTCCDEAWICGRMTHGQTHTLRGVELRTEIMRLPFTLDRARSREAVLIRDIPFPILRTLCIRCRKKDKYHRVCSSHTKFEITVPITVLKIE